MFASGQSKRVVQRASLDDHCGRGGRRLPATLRQLTNFDCATRLKVIFFTSLANWEYDHPQQSDCGKCVSEPAFHCIFPPV